MIDTILVVWLAPSVFVGVVLLIHWLFIGRHEVESGTPRTDAFVAITTPVLRLAEDGAHENESEGLGPKLLEWTQPHTVSPVAVWSHADRSLWLDAFEQMQEQR